MLFFFALCNAVVSQLGMLLCFFQGSNDDEPEEEHPDAFKESSDSDDESEESSESEEGGNDETETRDEPKINEPSKDAEIKPKEKVKEHVPGAKVSTGAEDKALLESKGEEATACPNNAAQAEQGKSCGVEPAKQLGKEALSKVNAHGEQPAAAKDDQGRVFFAVVRATNYICFSTGTYLCVVPVACQTLMFRCYAT